MHVWSSDLDHLELKMRIVKSLESNCRIKHVREPIEMLIRTILWWDEKRRSVDLEKRKIGEIKRDMMVVDVSEVHRWKSGAYIS